MKKILIIGGSGFLGSHVADAFSNKGYQVTIFDKAKYKFLKKNQKETQRISKN
jgi:UDP-glucose 4-epimerase